MKKSDFFEPVSKPQRDDDGVVTGYRNYSRTFIISVSTRRTPFGGGKSKKKKKRRLSDPGKVRGSILTIFPNNQKRTGRDRPRVVVSAENDFSVFFFRFRFAKSLEFSNAFCGSRRVCCSDRAKSACTARAA